MKRFFLYCMMGAVLALAGCNGNGGGGMAPTPPTTPTTPTPTSFPVSLGQLLMGYMTVPAGTYTVAAGGTMDVGHATFSCPAGGSACRIMVMANGTVTSNRGGVTAMPSQSARTAKMAADEAARRAAEAAKKETDGLIMTIRSTQTAIRPHDWAVFRPGVIGPTGLMLEKEPSQVTITPDTWNAGYVPLPGIAIGRERWYTASPPATFDPLGDTLNQQPERHLTAANTPEFMNRNMNTTLGEFAGEVHERTMTDGNKTTTDELMVYHNKQASGPVKYSEYYSAGSRVESRTTARSGSNFGSNNGRPGVTGVDYNNNANGVLTIDTSALNATATALFAAPNDNFPSVNNQTFNYTGNTGEKPRRFPGTFHGVAGEYNCTGTCRIAKGNDGNFDFNGNWTFTPTEKANEILLPNLDHDTDYLVFGTWLRTVRQPGQDPTYLLGAFRGGSLPFGRNVTSGTNPPFRQDNQQIQDLRGRATYKGSAAGRYGLRTLNTDGSVKESFTGSFTAKTTLMAQFGDTSGNVSINDQYSIRGTITEFTDPRNPGTDLSAWSVQLQRAKFGYATGSSARAGQEQNLFPAISESQLAGGEAVGMTGTTAGPIVSGFNSGWRGQFFGPTAASNATAAVKGSTHPTGVAGGFKANFINGEAFGGYGATLQE